MNTSVVTAVSLTVDMGLAASCWFDTAGKAVCWSLAGLAAIAGAVALGKPLVISAWFAFCLASCVWLQRRL